MALNNMGLGFIFTAKDLASGTMQKLDKNFRQLDDVSEDTATHVARNFQLMGQGIGLMAMGGGALMGLKALADQAGDFEAAVKSAGLIAGTKTPEELQKFEDAAIDAGIATQFSPTEAVKGLESLASGGMNAKQSLDALNPTLSLAAASLGQLSVEEAGGVAVQAMNIFGAKTDEVADKLTQLANTSAVSFDEMKIGLGTVGTGAHALHQSMDEALIVLGLARGQIGTIERASTAASVAMQRLVDPKHRKGIEEYAQVIDPATGKFNDFLDVVVDLQKNMAGLSESDRSAKLLKAFGSEGLAGVQAVFTSLEKGVEGANGELLKGADAVDELRRKMKGAADEGVAKKFSEEMLNTFQGQKTLLKGSMETLAITAGKPLAKIFAPIVTHVANGINYLIKVFRNMSPTTQMIIAKVAVLSSALVALIGAMAALKGAFAIARIAGLTSFSPLIAGLAPMIPLILGIGLAAAALKIAWDNNFGGIQEIVAKTWATIKLFGEGLSQLFSQGGFSGDVQKALGAPENSGLKEFLIDVYQDGYRVYKFFLGMWKGFEGAILQVEPAFDELWQALIRLWDAVTALIAPFFKVGDAVPSAEFESFGAYLGDVLGRLLTYIISVVGTLIDYLAAFGEGVVSVVSEVAPYFEYLWQNIVLVWDAVVSVVEAIFGATDASSDWGAMFEWLGKTVGWLAGLLAGGLGWALGLVADILGFVAEVIKGVVMVFTWVADKLNWIVDSIFGASEEASKAVDKVNSIDQKGGDKGPEVLGALDHSGPVPGGTMSKFNVPTDLTAAGGPKPGAAPKSVRPVVNASSLGSHIPGASSEKMSVGGSKLVMGGLPEARGATKAASADDMKWAFKDAVKELIDKQPSQTIILQLDGNVLAKVTTQKKKEDDQRTYKNLMAPE